MEQAAELNSFYTVAVVPTIMTPLEMQHLLGVSPANQRQIRQRAGFTSRVNEDGTRRSGYLPYEAAKFAAVHFMMKLGMPASETVDYSVKAAESILYLAMTTTAGMLFGAGPKEPDELPRLFYSGYVGDYHADWIKDATGERPDPYDCELFETMIRTDEQGWRLDGGMDDVLDEEDPVAYALIDFSRVANLLVSQAPLGRVIEADVDPDTLLWALGDPHGDLAAMRAHRAAVLNEVFEKQKRAHEMAN